MNENTEVGSVATQIMNAPAASAGVDIFALDAVEQASVGHEFEVKDPAGKSYKDPIFFTVIGRNADPVNDFYTKQINEYIQRQEHARKRGKTADSKTAEQLRDDNIAGAAVRVVGWRGIKQGFDRALLAKALRRNPHWIDQVVEESDELGNFTPTPATS